MQFTPTKEHMEISLQDGLEIIQKGDSDKLFSDGLDDYEYIYFDKEKGFCYEDNCVIGRTYDQTLSKLYSLKWCFNHKFYIKRNNDSPNKIQ